jgi:hypothetical protein
MTCLSVRYLIWTAVVEKRIIPINIYSRHWAAGYEFEDRSSTSNV